MLVVVLALASASLSAFSAAGEQRAASHAGKVAKRRHRDGAARAARLGFVAVLLTSPLWLGSWAVDAGSFFAQAGALQLGSLSVVQPLMVTTLLFALPLSAWGHRCWPHARDWAGALAICTGLALVLANRGAAAASEAPTAALPVALGVVAAGAVALLLLAVNRGPALRAPLLSVAAGALFAVGASITKLAADTLVTDGFAGLVTSWPGYALAVVSLASFALQQVAYASGPLATAVTAAVITDPLASYAIGVVGYGEPLPAAGAPTVMTVVGVVVLAGGVRVLAHSPLLAAGRQPELPPHTAVRHRIARLTGTVAADARAATRRSLSRS